MGNKDAESLTSHERLTRVCELLKQTTSMGVVRDFLRQKQLAHSASSWDSLFSTRVFPAIESGDLLEADLTNLLRGAEECGRQHIFLYRCKNKERALELMDRARVASVLNSKGLLDLLKMPAILDQPDSATISDVRWDTAKVDMRLTVKIVETRVAQEFVGEQVEHGMLVKRYGYVKERAVNIARLHRDGLLELRIGSHRNSSQYLRDIRAIWNMIDPILSESDFSPLMLTKLKVKLWDEQATLKGKVRYSDSVVRNEFGTALRASAGTDDYDLMSDAGAVSGVDAFLKADGGAYIDSHNIWLTAEANGISKEMHILISGDANEFAIPSNCSAEDYENALTSLRALNS